MGRLIDNKSWKVIEITIRRYPEQKRKLEEMLEDIVLTKGSDSGKTNFDTEYSKPQSVTESKALKLNSGYYARIKRQVNAVENVYNNLRPEEQKVIAARYWTDPDKKIPYAYLNCDYSEIQMKRIVLKVFYQVGVLIGEIERPE